MTNKRFCRIDSRAISMVLVIGLFMGMSLGCTGLAAVSQALEIRPTDWVYFTDTGSWDRTILRIRNSWDRTEVGLLMIPIDQIPGNAVIESATLVMWNFTWGRDERCNVDNDPLHIHRIKTPWIGAEANWENASSDRKWDNPGVDYHGVPYATTTASGWMGEDDIPYPYGGNASPLIWDITDLVKEWQQGLHPNHGILFIADKPDLRSGRMWITLLVDRYLDAADRADFYPRLILEYTLD